MSEAVSEGVPEKPLEGGWQRWQMQEVGAACTPAAATSHTLCLVNGVVKEGIAKAPQQTHQQGYEDGHEKGYRQGHQQGLQDGFEKGQEDGREKGREEGYAAGYEAGHKTGNAEGLKAGEQQVQAILGERTAKLDALLGAAERELAQLGEQLSGQLARAVLELALSMARQITQTSLQVNQAALLDTLKNVLKTQPEQPQGASLRLYVHPDDEQILAPFLQALLPRPNWQIITDKKIEAGGCVLQSALGQVDATLQTRWQRVTHAAQSVLPMQPQPQTA